MELKYIPNKLKELCKKYKFVALVLIAGVLLMALPVKKGEEKVFEEVNITQEETSVSDELSKILCLIDGAGDVQVFLTVSAGEETIYQTDEDITASDSSNTTRVTTIVVTDANRSQAGLVKQINPPLYLGAIVVCQGAEKASVRLAIVDAVSKVTGLGADSISVLKMK